MYLLFYFGFSGSLLMCAGFSRGEQGPLSSFSARALFAMPPLVAEHGL